MDRELKVDQNKVIIVQGSTASGKTTLAIQLALFLQTEIISCDSRQFYKEMSVGTAKPSADELKMVKHHFIDCASVQNEISSAQYARLAEPILTELLNKYGFALVVGGSGMFLDALIDGIDDVPVNSEIRSDLTEIFKRFGFQPLLDELLTSDPVFYEQVDRNNPIRIIRALEAIRESGRKMSELQTKKKRVRQFSLVRFCIDWPRDILYQRINQRVDEMVKFGLIREVTSLLKHRNLNPLNTVGYKEIFDCLDGKITEDRAIDLIKQHSRNYAKRQQTWLRRYEDLISLNPLSEKSIIEQALKRITN
jgi:tRNA dimethylallyltransferase